MLVAEIVQGLLKRGCVRIAGDEVSLAAPHSVCVLAIEAKLYNWREALDQALEYKRFSDFSYVMLPATAIGPAANNRELFTTAGIGLITFREGRIQTVCKPRRARDHDWRREFVASRILGQSPISAN
jgi:hypothetical protein